VHTPKNTPRLLGAAFLIVVFTSLSSGLLARSAVGSGSLSEMLVSIARNDTLMRISILGDLVTSVGVIVLAVLLYCVLSATNRIIALVGLGAWLAEAVALAVSKLGSSALIPLSQQFVEAGMPEHSFYQTLGEFLYYGVAQLLGSTTHMFFYCVGGILWYFLFYQSNFIPRIISLFGLAAVCVGLAGIVAEFLGYTVSIFVLLPILPFELTIGAWLVIRGIRDASETPGRRLGLGGKASEPPINVAA
jgi:Domain of unknown function (DUF4386)